MPRKIKAINAKTGELMEVDIDAIKRSPIRNPSLPDALLDRVRAIHERIRDAYTVNLEQFEIGFMRDGHPEKQVAVWERISVAFEKVTKAMPELEKKLVLRTLLAYSMMALTAKEQADPVVKRIIEAAEG